MLLFLADYGSLYFHLLIHPNNRIGNLKFSPYKSHHHVRTVRIEEDEKLKELPMKI